MEAPGMLQPEDTLDPSIIKAGLRIEVLWAFEDPEATDNSVSVEWCKATVVGPSDTQPGAYLLRYDPEPAEEGEEAQDEGEEQHVIFTARHELKSVEDVEAPEQRLSVLESPAAAPAAEAEGGAAPAPAPVSDSAPAESDKAAPGPAEKDAAAEDEKAEDSDDTVMAWRIEGEDWKPAGVQEEEEEEEEEGDVVTDTSALLVETLTTNTLYQTLPMFQRQLVTEKYMQMISAFKEELTDHLKARDEAAKAGAAESTDITGEDIQAVLVGVKRKLSAAQDEEPLGKETRLGGAH